MTDKLNDLWQESEAAYPGLHVDPAICSGEYTIFDIDEETGLWTPRFSKQNLVLYSWGFIACQCIGLGSQAYKVGAAYVEYLNVPLPGQAVPVPTYDRSSGLAYFNSLPPNQDYLRVPLAAVPTIDIAPGSEPYFIAGVNGNRVTFVAQTAGTFGVNGVTFSDAVRSKVFGISLVATPNYADHTADIILSRGYFNVSDQQLKQTGSQVGIRWAIAFR
jgi:hypothetical protein